jgi:hypothetical protein
MAIRVLQEEIGTSGPQHLARRREMILGSSEWKVPR